ncbi:MAG: hypothetical protein IT496_01635 [Gammaproteobacteria bacterium]|nr:hypothetical protein [Gammaproteobacteria bacterium]
MAKDIKFTISAEDKTDRAFNSLKGNLARLQTSASQLRGVLAGAFSALGAGTLAGSFAQFANYAGEVKKVAAATGQTVEEVSRLGFVASQLDTDLGSLAKGVAQLSKTMFESVNGNEELARLFRALGVSVTDTAGTLRQPVEVLADLATALTRVQDPAARLAVQQKILGRNAVELAPLLAEGGEALRKFADQADRLGVTISADTVNAIDELGDNLSALKQAATGLAATKLGPFLGDLARLSTLTVNAASSMDALGQSRGAQLFARLNQVLSVMTNPLSAVQAGFHGLTAAIDEATDASERASESLGPSNPRGRPRVLTAGDLIEQSNDEAKGKAAKAEKDPRIEAEEKALEEANKKLTELLREREDIKQSFLELDREISRPAAGLAAGTVLEPIRAIDAARVAKDPKEALRLAEEAREQLRALAEAGTVSDQFLKSLAGQAAEVAEQAAAAQEAAAKDQVDRIRQQLEELQKAAELEVGFDEASAADNIAKMAALLQAEATKHPIKFLAELAAPSGAFDALPALAGGGYVRGPGSGTSDSILARLSNGEYVIPANAVARYGVAFLERLSRMQLATPALPRFAAGGLVNATAARGSNTLNFHLPNVGTISVPGVDDAVAAVVTRQFQRAALKIGRRR